MKDGGTLTVSTAHDEESESVTAAVHNTGSQIRKSDLHRVFEPFYSSKEGEGTGLGLTICRSIVSRHGGKIEVTSKRSGKNKGVTFAVSLPLHHSASTRSQGE
jgi:signal transduction histidine kinase